MNPNELFETHRGLLFGIAYRMLGSVMEAEDIVQEIYIHWLDVDHEQIESPRAYLSTMVTRLCIDHLRSARHKRETYIGPWLPEPLVTKPEDDPGQAFLRAEAVSTAFMVMMEELTPEQRAAFLLREVFDYDYATIAAILEKSEANSRQLVSRARRLLRGAPVTEPVSLPEQMAIAQEFWSALQEGDVEGVLSVMAEDITWWSDGGGKATAARRSITGSEQVLRFMIGLMRLAPEGVSTRWTIINQQPGVIVYVDGKAFNTITLDVQNGQINTIYAVVNPDKLQNLPDL